ncbi:MAG: hypothetical protein AAFN77_02850 [Planctomycetota bacterium]
MSTETTEEAVTAAAVESGQPTIVIPVWFWVVAAVALVWNLMGVYMFIEQMNMSEAAYGAMEPEVAELYKQVPMWANIAFGVAVIAGTLGSGLLLARSKFATAVLVISVIGVAAQQAYFYFMSDIMTVMGPSGMVMPAVVMIVAIGLIAFSTSSREKLWLR